MHQSSILVAWINDGRLSFLLWLKLRLLVVFGEGIWGCGRCNSAMDFFWVVKLPRLHDAQPWIVFSFKYTLYDFKGFQLVSISVSFCELGVELCTQDLVKFLRSSFVHSLFCEAGQRTTYVYSQRQSWALVLLRLKLPEPGNMYLLEMATNLLLCGFHLVMFCWTRYHTNLEQMLKKNRQNIPKNGHWMLETSCKVGLQPEGGNYRHSETATN